MEIKKIGVVGAGTMGSGICQVFAFSGFDVIMIDIRQDLLDGGLRKIDANLSKAVQLGKIKADEKEKTLSRIRATLSMSELRDCDLVVEAVFEDFDAKARVFGELNRVCKKTCIFATNTSTIPITKLGSVSGREDRFIGMHFFNPVHLMKLVEVVNGKRTSAETHKAVEDTARMIGKVPVTVTDSPGFAANRMLMVFINEAVSLVEKGIAAPEAVDTVAKLGFNHPLGPLEVADLIGLDICCNIMNILHGELKDGRYRPCRMLSEKVKRGELGRKSGKGFYEYK